MVNELLSKHGPSGRVDTNQQVQSECSSNTPNDIIHNPKNPDSSLEWDVLASNPILRIGMYLHSKGNISAELDRRKPQNVSIQIIRLSTVTLDFHRDSKSTSPLMLIVTMPGSCWLQPFSKDDSRCFKEIRRK